MKSYTKVDLAKALESVSPSVRFAYEASHERLYTAGIPHVIVGGLAVNAHGLHYSTKDVDYLLNEAEAFDGTVVVSHKSGVPISVGDVAIDYVVINGGYPKAIREAMRESIEAAAKLPEKVAVVADWLLVWMKLNANRPKDRAAVVGLIQAGLDVEAVRSALSKVGDDRVSGLFERCFETAAAE